MSRGAGVHRGRLEIVKDILSVAAGAKGVRKTHVMYGANLSYTGLRRYLNELLELGLLERHERLYMITGKGKRFLALYEEFNRSMERLMELTEVMEGSRKTLDAVVAR